MVLELDVAEKSLTKAQEKACAAMMYQVSEGVTFINTYVRQKYCKPHLPILPPAYLIPKRTIGAVVGTGIYRDYTGIMTNFVDTLEAMRKEFHSSGAIDTQICVHRILNSVENIRKCHEPTPYI